MPSSSSPGSISLPTSMPVLGSPLLEVLGDVAADPDPRSVPVGVSTAAGGVLAGGAVRLSGVAEPIVVAAVLPGLAELVVVAAVRLSGVAELTVVAVLPGLVLVVAALGVLVAVVVSTPAFA